MRLNLYYSTQPARLVAWTIGFFVATGTTVVLAAKALVALVGLLIGETSAR